MSSFEHMADFGAWEAEMTPFGADLLVDQTAETSVERTLACSNPGDVALLEIAPEDIEALSLR
jgi:hypothetical protein